MLNGPVSSVGRAHDSYARSLFLFFFVEFLFFFLDSTMANFEGHWVSWDQDTCPNVAASYVATFFLECLEDESAAEMTL